MIRRTSTGERVAGTGYGAQGAGGLKTYAADGTRTDLTGGSGGTDVALDLGDTGSPQSLAINEIATIYDRFSVATEPSPNKLLLDFNRLDDKYLSPYPASPATPDDEFDSGTLNAKWNVVSGSSGTVDPYAEVGTDVTVYDLATRPGWLMIQVGDDTTDSVMLRQDYTLVDGSALYLKVATACSNNNSFQVRFMVNSSDTDPLGGTYTGITLSADATNAWNLFFDAGVGGDIAGSASNNATAIVAIARRDLAYHTWASCNGGESWMPGTRLTFESEATRVWIAVQLTSGQGSDRKVPIVAIDWLRLGDDNVYSPGW